MKKIASMATLLLSVATLSGCTNVRQAYFGKTQEEIQVENEARIASFKTQCIAAGFPANSQENAFCTLELLKAYTGRQQVTVQQGSSNGGSGLSFMCKNAIASGDSGAINVHCN